MAILQKNVVLDTNGSNPHHDFSDRVLEEGDPVVVDLGEPQVLIRQRSQRRQGIVYAQAIVFQSVEQVPDAGLVDDSPPARTNKDSCL